MPDELEHLLEGLRPGADLDLRGLVVPETVFEALLQAVTGPDKRPHLGRARFDGATLPAHTSLSGACFEGDCSFDGARFAGGVSFFDARFLRHASFRGARFSGNASFHGASFQRHVSFDEAVFAGDALFGETDWRADASFTRATFVGAAAFDRARFGRDAVLRGARFGGAVSFRRVRVARNARFDQARFRHDLWMGPLAAGGLLRLTHATAHGGLRVDAMAQRIEAGHVVVRGPADFRLRHAEVDLEDATFSGDVTVRSLLRPIQCLNEPSGRDAKRDVKRDGPDRARVVSLRGVDAPRLELADVDLSRCRFAGLACPGGFRITGDYSFATTRLRLRPRRRSRGHAVLAEDLAGSHTGLSALYRQLADAADAADPSDHELARDFRYRAREIARRADPRAWHRWLLHVSWLTCGHGLRTGRLLACLAVLTLLVCGGAVWACHGQQPPGPGHAHARPRPQPHPVPAAAAAYAARS